MPRPFKTIDTGNDQALRKLCGLYESKSVGADSEADLREGSIFPSISPPKNACLKDKWSISIDSRTRAIHPSIPKGLDLLQFRAKQR